MELITNLKTLARERPLVTSELVKLNDCYGHAYVLKKYAGFKETYQIKAVIEHACMMVDQIWVGDLALAMPSHFTFSDYRFPLLRQITNKALFAIGPSIHYADPLFSQDELGRLRKAMGKTLLVFLPHSSVYIYVHFDEKKIISYIKNFEKDFENILICFGWRDVLRDLEKPFVAEGYTCVTAGHVFDNNFLSRLKSLILLSTHTMSFDFGTHIGFCIYLNRPHWVAKIDTKIEAPESIKKTATYNPTPLAENQSLYFLKYFKEPRDDISAKQKELVDLMWGISCIKSPEELSEILHITEDIYKNSYLPCDRNNPVMLRQIIDYLEKNQINKARSLLKYLKNLHYHPGWISYFKEIILLKEKGADSRMFKKATLKFIASVFKNNGTLSDPELKKIFEVYPKPRFFAHKKLNLPWKEES